jgi:hypothetical protein
MDRRELFSYPLFAMLKAYHIISPSSLADAGRLGNSAYPEHQERIIKELSEKHKAIIHSGALRPACAQEHSRQFALDRLVGDNQYVFLSVGKRYWHTPDEANFGFLFDAEQLLLHHDAILRDEDLMQDYEDLLDEIVSEYTISRDPSQWTEEEKKALFEALENPEKYSDYKSPDEDYHNLIDAIQHGDMAVPYAREATEQFIRRAHHLQKQKQYTGHEALQMASERSESGHYELLIKDRLYIPLCKGYVRDGQEMLKNADQERTIAEYVQEYRLDRFVLTNATRDGMKGESWGLPARQAGSIRMIKQGDFDTWYLHYLQNKQKRALRKAKISSETP